jgi:hypothetical protein
MFAICSFFPAKGANMTEQIEPPPARHADGRFGPGNPGRRPGSRNRASHRALTAILDDFHDNKDVVLPRLRKYRVHQGHRSPARPAAGGFGPRARN